MTVATKEEMTIKETVKALVPFYFDCLHYWESQGKEHDNAVHHALTDLSNIQTDPYSPNGKYLHEMTKHCVIEFFKENN